MNDSEELWDKRYSDNPVLNPPSEFLEEFEQYLPNQGTCVDIAGGNGRNALWFAKKGYTTSVIDISSVALNKQRRALNLKKWNLNAYIGTLRKTFFHQNEHGI